MKLQELKTNEDPAIQKSVAYIYELGSELKISVDEWDAGIFGEDLGKLPISEVNSRFMLNYRRMTRDSKLTLKPEHEAALKQASPTFQPGNISQIENDIRSLRNSVNDYNRQIGEWQKRIWTLEGERLAYQKPGEEYLLKEIEAILRQGFWEILSVAPGSSRLVSFISDPVVLTFPQPDGRDFRTDFGRIKFWFDNQGYLGAYDKYSQEHAKVRYSSGHFFPFIDTGGSICWGSGKSTINELQKKGKISDQVQLLHSLLTTYPGGTPYVFLEQFFLEGKEVHTGKKAPWLLKLSNEERAKYGLSAIEPMTALTPEPPPPAAPPGATRNGNHWNNFTCPACGDRWNLPDTQLQCNACQRDLSDIPNRIIPETDQTCEGCGHNWTGHNEDDCPECGNSVGEWVCDSDESTDDGDGDGYIYGCGHTWTSRGEEEECPNCSYSFAIRER